jgi:hypothetical protein
VAGVGTQAYGDYADPSLGAGASYGDTPQGYDFSQQGYDATNYYPTLDAATSAFYAANPTAPGNPNSQQSTTQSATAAPNTLQPAYLPTAPTAQATTYDPATYNASTYNNSYNPQTATNELNQAAGVQDQSQNQNLMSMLAAQGISPGSSAAQAAAQNLSASQTAALAPSLVSAQQYGAGLNEQSGLSNQSALNAASSANAGAENTAGQYNAGASNTATLQNLQDLLQQQEYNANAYNSAENTQAGYQNQDYLAQLQGQLGLQDQGLSTSGALASDQANQTVPVQPSLFSQIASGVSGAASAASNFYPSVGGSSYTPPAGSYDPAGTGIGTGDVDSY